MDSLATINSNNPSSALARNTDPTGKINYSGLQPGQFFDAKGNVTGTPQTTPWQTGSSYNPTSNNVSTTTISNTNKMNQVPGLVTNLNNVANKGISTNASGTSQYANGALVPQPPETGNTLATTKTPAQAQYTDPAGIQRNADGTQASIPEGATYNGNGQYTLDGKKYAPPVADTSVQDKQTNDLLDQMKATTDANTADQIANIQRMFDLRKQQQTQTNQGQQGGITNALLMGGVTGQGSSSQYAPISSQNIISAQESYGIQELAQLDAEENNAIAAARAAQQTGNFALLDKKLALIDKQRAEKVAAAAKLNDQILEQNKVLADQTKQSNIDNSIADLYSQGVTDPSKILTQLNANGENLTAKQIQDTLSKIIPSGVNDLVKTLQANGAPTNVIQKVLSSPNMNDAYTNAGNWASVGGTGDVQRYNIYKAQALDAGQVPLGFNDFLQADEKTKNDAAIALKQAVPGKAPTVSSSSGGTSGGVGSVPSTDPTTGNLANDVKAVLEGRNTLYNIRQTMGRTNKAAAYMESMRKAIDSADPSFDYARSDAGGKAVSSTYYQKAISAIDSVLPNIDKITQLSDQVSRVGVKGVDALLQKGAIQIGDKSVSNFHEAQKLIADEIGLALGAGTVSDMKLQLGFDVTDPSVKPETFASNMAIVKEFIQNRKRGLTDLRYQSSTSNNDLTGSNLVQSEDQAKQTVNNFYTKATPDQQDTVKSLLQQGFNNAKVVQYLKAKGLMQ